MIFASKSTHGFYSHDIHGDKMPADAVEISDEHHAELMAAQSAGKMIDWSGGIPVAVDPPAPTLPQLIDAVQQQINAERDRREAATFSYRGKRIDCDPRAAQRITAAALAAQAALATGQSFEISWTCADNSVLTLDAAGVMGMPIALAQHANALHQHARQLKDAVNAAPDAEALAQIDIMNGWPEG